jgi:hypothetical protein
MLIGWMGCAGAFGFLWVREQALCSQLNRLLKKSVLRVPRRLKSARQIKNKRLGGTAEAMP